MSDPIYLPRPRGHRTKHMANLPHPSDSHRLQMVGSTLMNNELFVAELRAVNTAMTPAAQDALLSLLADCLTHGYRCATADFRTLLGYGKQD